ncbi:hypothetical protein CH273_18480 [Rhodococcus sp. 05-339-2]|nr:hypothetical protein CH273_18480 [Rhodococcus sp. 05-339-2]
MVTVPLSDRFAQVEVTMVGDVAIFVDERPSTPTVDRPTSGDERIRPPRPHRSTSCSYPWNVNHE